MPRSGLMPGAGRSSIQTGRPQPAQGGYQDEATARRVDKWIISWQALSMPDAGKFDETAAFDLASLNIMVNQIAELEDRIAETVRRLRSRFVPWVDIAEELGVTRQAAQQRYSRDDNPPVFGDTPGRLAEDQKWP